jgi:hypothetical protein
VNSNRMSLYLLFVLALLLATHLGAQTGKVSAAIQKAIVQQLVHDGEIDTECVGEAGGTSRVVSITPIDLNFDGKPEFFVYGAAGCAFGANSPFGWVYSKSAKGYEMLLDAGLVQEITRKRATTRGYRDLGVTKLGNFSTNWKALTATYKFDGSRYRAAK